MELAAAVGHQRRSWEEGHAGADQNEPAGAACATAARSGAPVVVTLGADGALVVSPDGQVEVVAAGHVAVVDTTGAGDTFNGVLGTRLGTGDSLIVAVRAATVAATLSVSCPGARGYSPARGLNQR